MQERRVDDPAPTISIVFPEASECASMSIVEIDALLGDAQSAITRMSAEVRSIRTVRALLLQVTHLRGEVATLRANLALAEERADAVEEDSPRLDADRVEGP